MRVTARRSVSRDSTTLPSSFASLSLGTDVEARDWQSSDARYRESATSTDDQLLQLPQTVTVDVEVQCSPETVDTDTAMTDCGTVRLL